MSLATIRASEWLYRPPALFYQLPGEQQTPHTTARQPEKHALCLPTGIFPFRSHSEPLPGTSPELLVHSLSPVSLQPHLLPIQIKQAASYMYLFALKKVSCIHVHILNVSYPIRPLLYLCCLYRMEPILKNWGALKLTELLLHWQFTPLQCKLWPIIQDPVNITLCSIFWLSRAD